MTDLTDPGTVDHPAVLDQRGRDSGTDHHHRGMGMATGGTMAVLGVTGCGDVMPQSRRQSGVGGQPPAEGHLEPVQVLAVHGDTGGRVDDPGDDHRGGTDPVIGTG